MSDQDDFAALRPTFSSIAEENLKTSPMPIEEYVRESEQLLQRAESDFAQLAAMGLSRDWLNTLKQRTGALRHAQSHWLVAFKAQKEALKTWKTRAPEAYELRDDFIAACRFALRNDDEVQKTVTLIAEGNSHADMIQDLSALAILGRKYAEPLAAIGWDEAAINSAEQTGSEMATLLAEVDGNREEGNPDRVVRDQAFTYLKEAVDEVRAYGKYVYRRQAKHMSFYQSNYISRKNSSTRDSGEINSAAPAA